MIKNIYKKLLSEKKRITIREHLQRLLSPLYYGNNFYCNCCNKKFRKFLNKGNIPRNNAQCPFCFSLERTRVLDFYIEKELNLYQSEGVKLLHFAPEYALFRKIKKNKNIIYIDADINPAYASNVFDIINAPFPDNYFDYIICSHVLGHVPDEHLAIKELVRVLKPNGVAIIMTLLSGEEKTFEDENIKSSEDKLKFYSEFDLCRLHGNDFSNRLESSGFNVEEIDYRLFFSDEIQQKYSLGNGQREKIFKCTKNSK